jgi:transposase InsO family protein
MRLMSIVESAVSIREGCRVVGIHHSTYYDWLHRLERDGLEGLTPAISRTRRKSAARVQLEAEVVAWSLAHPAHGPARVFGELTNRGVAVGSPSQVWRILGDHRLNTRRHRYRLLAATRGLTEADHAATQKPPVTRWVGSLKADLPGDLVQMDCFQIGRLKEARRGVTKTPGMVWQYTAIDVASSFTWAELHTTAHNPSAIHTTALAYRVAHDLAHWGWHLTQISTDRGNEFVDHRFTHALTQLGVTHRYIPPGRPQSNGKVEQVQATILEECWKPSFINYTQPSITGLRQDLDHFLNDYNHHRPHRGKWNKGTPPIGIIIPNTGNQP